MLVNNLKLSFLLDNFIAHRGLHNQNIEKDKNKLLPENSLGAFQEAINKNYLIELDVHLLKDGTVVVFHDFNLKRMCGVDLIIEDLT
ncbi:MAG: hypothetical protein LBM99_03435, partial [Bacillales bacterium]|nr:hypothetical protein [Bacillales bacterium]